MEQLKSNYQESMLDKISEIIEKTGSEDASYDAYQKNNDILAVLENLLAYAICLRCANTDEVRDTCEATYVSMKRKALVVFDDPSIPKK
jgi:hypothetical protein